MTSEAQLNANRRNAQQSTGPRTPAGKEGSRDNAITHGAWRDRSRHVTTGPYREDPDDIEAAIAEIVQGLRPRDGLERFHARQVATVYLDLDRLATFKTDAIAGVTTDYRTPTPGPSDSAQEAQRTQLAALRAIERVLDKTCRLTRMLWSDLRTALAEYERLRARTLEQAYAYTGPLEADDPDVDQLQNAIAQSNLWEARVRGLTHERPQRV